MAKKITFIIGVIIGFLISYTEISGQTPATIYTPKGSDVSDTYFIPELSNAEIAAINSHAASVYPLATKIGNASSTYNCHAYAWHMTEGGNTVWLGAFTSTAEDIYWIDGSYIEVCNPTFPAKVSYASDNHSAITTSTSDMFRSKWGNFPLMEHDKDYTPYNSSNLKYYIKSPSITGPSQFCTTATYSIPNLPAGATVIWTATGSIGISSGNNVNPVSVTKSTNGTGTLTANINTTCGNFSVVKNGIYAGIPTFPAFASYPSSRCADQPYEFVPVIPAGVTVTSVTGLLGGVDQPLSETSPGRYLVPADVFRITMSMQNACGSVTVSKLISRASCGFRVAIYPNPANTSLTIAYEQEDNLTGITNEVKSATITSHAKDITLFNDKGNAVNSTTIKSGESKVVLDTRNIPNGTYYLHITEGKETIKKQIIIQH